jgi:beta-phosphoglucomutase-like phosphatase (HAD superfamily)
VFDWDGTIMDSTGLIAECIQLAARDLNLPVPSVESAKSIIGLGIHDSVKRLFPQLTPEGQAKYALTYRRHYVGRDHEAPLMPVYRILAGLRVRTFRPSPPASCGPDWSVLLSTADSSRISTSRAVPTKGLPSRTRTCCTS